MTTLTRIGLLVLGVALASGCDDGTTPPADGGASDGGASDGGSFDAGSFDAGSFDAGSFDAGPLPMCGAPDRACPAEQPHDGAPCEYADACMYVIDTVEWTHTCVSGAWHGESLCPPGGACVPPLAESCSMPVRDHGAGVVEVGPVLAGAFRPFTDGEEIAVIYGGQGSPMVEFRVRTESDAPDCTELISTLRSPVATDVLDRLRLRTRCGRSLGIFTILPQTDPCPDPPGLIDVELEVELTGIGSTTVNLRIPSEAFCVPLRG